MTVRSAADYLLARQVARGYRDMAAAIDVEGRNRNLRNMPLTQRKIRHYAIIARRAALAEELDPPCP